MPLYMDFHKFPRITIEEAKRAHYADERIQQDYGVRYHQFWVNEEAGNLFCLVEGPDIVTVESVHRIAHGHIACAIVEVDPGYYSLIMGNNFRIDQGLVYHDSGVIDLGYRFISVVSIRCRPSENGSQGHQQATATARESALREISTHGGRVVKATGDDSLISVFNSPDLALQSARAVQRSLGRIEDSVSFSIGLSAGQPVTANNEFIEETIRLSKRLGKVAGEGCIVVSSLFDELCSEALLEKGKEKIKSLNAGEEGFLTELFCIIDAELANENFTIESLVRTAGVSRAQLYRKIRGLTGKAPNIFLRGLRLEKAWSLLKRKTGNISEVAFEVGFSNPSYFAKCFAKKFGCLPSRVHDIQGVEDGSRG
jgi:AraC-like DNA-binding protein